MEQIAPDLPEQEADPSQQNDSGQDGQHEDPQRDEVQPPSHLWINQNLNLPDQKR